MLQANGRVVISTRDFFCDASRCYALKQDSLLYDHHHHLNSMDSKLFVEFLAKGSDYFWATVPSTVHYWTAPLRRIEDLKIYKYKLLTIKISTN